MKLSTTIATLFASAASAAPSAVNLDKRDTMGVLLCTERDFTGHCVPLVSAPSECVTLGADLIDQTDSVQPDANSFCYFFVGSNCSASSDFFHVGFPGVADLSLTPNESGSATINFQNKLSSYFCVNDSGDVNN